MSATWDHRQLVAAENKLRRAAGMTATARERLNARNAEPALRAMFALREAEAAMVDLRRFARRHGEQP